MSAEAIGMGILGLGLPVAAAILKVVPQRPAGAYVSKEVFDTTIVNIKESLQTLGKKLDALIDMHMRKE